ncbi:hypothetical protein GCM10028807_44700 [Spirosoma daeguense]
MDQEIRLRIILEKPMPDIDFGLQKGSGRIYETVQKQRANVADLVFDFSIRIKGNPDEQQPPGLSGHYVQGPSNSRFVYIDIGTYAGQQNASCSGRLKIPLQNISWDMVHQIAADSSLVLQTRVSGTTKDGKPALGTVKPFNGWHVT